MKSLASTIVVASIGTAIIAAFGSPMLFRIFGISRESSIAGDGRASSLSANEKRPSSNSPSFPAGQGDSFYFDTAKWELRSGKKAVYAHNVLRGRAQQQALNWALTAEFEANLAYIDIEAQQQFFSQSGVWPAYIAAEAAESLSTKNLLFERTSRTGSGEYIAQVSCS